MRIAICDDDSVLVAILRAHVESWALKNGKHVTISSFESAENFLLNWTSSAMFDLLFLDIKMKKMTGMELAEVIRKVDSEMDIVFVTADRDLVFKGYEVGALNYLVKPIEEEDCHKCLTKASERLLSSESSSLVVQIDGRLVRIRYDDIMYFESVAHYLHIHTVKEKLRYRKKIGETEIELSDMKEFMRIHRSYLVNLRYVNSVEDNSVVLENKVALPISRKYWQDTYRAFVSYYAHV